MSFCRDDGRCEICDPPTRIDPDEREDDRASEAVRYVINTVIENGLLEKFKALPAYHETEDDE